MNIREISDIFKDTADNITAIKSYNFGWASDRVRQGNTEDFQELNEFPRIFFSVPTITGSDQTRKQDTYQVTLFFDDLLGYDNEGDEDPTLQIDKWANLQQYANYFIQRLNKIKQSILPNYLFIPEAPSITFDSFTGIQRMITVQLSFNLVVPTNCDPGVITLVQCIANIVTSSNLTASLKSIIKFAASLEGRATVTADIALVQKVASSLNAFGTLTGDINFVQKAQASLLTSSSVTGNIIIPKLVQASLTGAGTTAANLTVQAAGFDADAQAFFNRVTTAGGTLTATEQNAVNTLVVQMKADGIWTKMNAIYPMVGASAAACAQNLKSSSFTASFTGMTFASTGVKGNGTTSYMETNFNLTQISLARNFVFGGYQRIQQLREEILFGNSGGVAAPRIELYARQGTGSYFLNIGGVFINDTNPDARGFYLGKSNAAGTHAEAYKNGTLFKTGLSTPALKSATMWLGAINGYSAYSSNEFAFAFIGDGQLSAGDVTNFYNIVQTFQTTLNRNV
jgi:hypothetical protein